MKKLWLYFPASFIHFFSPILLKIYSQLFPSKNSNWHSFKWRHLHFRNPLGIAGGVDKNAFNIKEWERLGAGFYEIGTVTPKVQKPNPSKIIDRNLRHLSLWNHMGFPNQGLLKIKKRILRLKERPSPLFINIGKNRDTPIDYAVKDYLEGIQSLESVADAFVINISSPNSPHLRSLFQKEQLQLFLKTLRAATDKPLLLKLHPDLEDEDFFRIIDKSLRAGVDGWILCNSTQSRSVPHIFPEHGGVSGKMLSSLSIKSLKKLKSHLENKKEFKDQLIISVGGVLDAKDALERLRLGAHLVQVYTALVFEGPSFFKKARKHFKNQKTIG